MAYGKVFESMFTGSMVGIGPTVFAVWTYCISTSKPPGIVELNSRILATILGCSAEEVDAAIEVLCSPDPDSRSPEHEGRRLIKEGNFLYSMPTWQKYVAIRREEDRRQQNRKAQAEWRRKQASASSKHGVSEREQDKPTEMEMEMNTEHPPQPPKGGERKPALVIERPESVPEQVWKDWLSVRKAKKFGAVTPTVMARMDSEAKKAGLTLAQAIEESASNEWRGFKAEWLQDRFSKSKTSPNGNRGHMPHDTRLKDYSDTGMDD